MPQVGVRRSHRETPATGPDDRLTAAVQEWFQFIGAASLSGRVTVIWNGRLKTTAGTACTRNACIELNPLLRDFGPEQIRRTLKHEAAHLIAHWRTGRRRIQTHGRDWRQACADLGIPDEPAFHDLPLPRRRVPRKYAYRCRRCGFTVLRVRLFDPYTACFRCCKKHTGGKYHPDYLFLRVPFQPAVRK